MKQGDLVTLYIPDYPGAITPRPPATGIIVDVVGYKTSVLCGGDIEHWDISDLEKMKKWMSETHPMVKKTKEA